MTMNGLAGTLGSGLGLAAAAGGFYCWQKNLVAQSSALFKKAAEARTAGHLGAAEEASLQAVACASRTWIGREDLRALALHDLAHIYYQQNKLEQAEQTAVK